MSRFLALLAAAVMVVGAIVVRDLFNGRDEGTGDADTLELVCGTDLLAACNALAEGVDGSGITVRAEDEAVTAARLADGDLVLGDDTAWLAAGQWPEIAEAGGAQLPELAGSRVLARSPAVIVAREDRMAAIESACGPATWACIGNHAGGSWTDLGGEETWGRVEVALPDTTRGDGSVAVNQAVASRVGTTDFVTNDLDDPEVSTWFSLLASESASNSSGTTPLTRFLRVPGSLGVVGAAEAEAVDALSSAAVSDTVSVVAPEPLATTDVRLWSASDTGLADALDRLGTEPLGSALMRAGWRTVEESGATATAPADSIGADMRSLAVDLPGGDGMPAPGVVSAVNRRWEEER